jgi:Ca2+/Na+ antiporter
LVAQAKVPAYLVSKHEPHYWDLLSQNFISHIVPLQKFCMLLLVTLTLWLSIAIRVNYVTCKRSLNHQDHEASDLTQEYKIVVILLTGFCRSGSAQLCYYDQEQFASVVMVRTFILKFILCDTIKAYNSPT